MVTIKILNPRKIEEKKRNREKFASEADILIIFKFPYSFFFTTSFKVHSERLTALIGKRLLKVSPVGRGSYLEG